MKNVRPLLALVALTAATGAVSAQKSQEQLRAQRTKKLAKEVFKSAPWQLDYDAARRQAAKEGKVILAYFTRSFAA